MTVFVHSISIISLKFLFVDRLGPTATLKVRKTTLVFFSDAVILLGILVSLVIAFSVLLT